MITAGHCFPMGARVYTAGGTVGSYVYPAALGVYVGTVTGYAGHRDAEELDGAVLTDLAEMLAVEVVTIDAATDAARFWKELRWNQAYHRLAQGL